MEYLSDLLKEKKQLSVFKVFRHTERLVDEGYFDTLNSLVSSSPFLISLPPSSQKKKKNVKKCGKMLNFLAFTRHYVTCGTPQFR